MMIWGWDVSTAVIGLTVLDEAGRFVTAKYLDMRSDGRSVQEKCGEFRAFYESMLEELDPESDVAIHKHFVEDRLSGFRMGGSNANTIMKLAEMNAVVCWILLNDRMTTSYVVSVEKIHTSTIKSAMAKIGLVIPKKTPREKKKKLTLEFVRKVEPTFPVELSKQDNPKPPCYDMADAWAVAKAGHARIGTVESMETESPAEGAGRGFRKKKR